MEPVELTCSFLFSCSGYYRYDHGYLPDFEGMDDFTGTIVHPQAWPEDLDYTDKQVVVIGSGATAVTLVPAMAADAAHVTMLQRSPTYMASVPTRNPLAQLVRSVLPATHVRSGPAMDQRADDPGPVPAEQATSGAWSSACCDAASRAQLPAGYDIDTHFSPDYDPWDQRLCAVADGDLFKALRDGSVSIVTDHIERFTATGLRLASGAELDADVIVTATGLELLFLGGIEISVDGEELDATEQADLQGHDARGRTEPRHGRRLHQRLLDAEVPT